MEGRHSDNEELIPLGMQRSSGGESSAWNADDRIFLLEELEKKDNMLAMLTEGLREVRVFTFWYMVFICKKLPFAASPDT